MNIQSVLVENLKDFKTAPFLFIGSGFSRRYIGLEDWEGLLQKLCDDYLKDFKYYYSSANSDLTKTASLMAEDFHEIWWSDVRFEEERQDANTVSYMVDSSSALKFKISQYLMGKQTLHDSDLERELDELKKVPVDGIITTNWDDFIERLFPEYDVLIGQEDLINSNLQEIGEIYKIHGSVSKINSMVLTNEDYNNFNRKNAYLAAKLLSIIIEHPIIFLGYSISDPNIIEILTSISECISEEGMKILEKSLYFVEPIFDVTKQDTIGASYINIGSRTIPATLIKVHDYSNLYIPLQNYRRKFPVKLMKQIKSQLYEIVKENDPKDRIALIDFDEATDINNVDFVIGVGMKALHDKGLVGLKYKDVIEDIVMDNRSFNAVDMVEKALPEILVHDYYTPFNKYLKLGGYFDGNGNISPGLDYRIDKYRKKILNDLCINKVESYIKSKRTLYYDYSLGNVYILRAMIHQNIKNGLTGKENLEIEEIEKLLRVNYNRFNSDMSMSEASDYKILVRIYDWLKYAE